MLRNLVRRYSTEATGELLVATPPTSNACKSGKDLTPKTLRSILRAPVKAQVQSLNFSNHPPLSLPPATWTSKQAEENVVELKTPADMVEGNQSLSPVTQLQEGEQKISILDIRAKEKEISLSQVNTLLKKHAIFANHALALEIFNEIPKLSLSPSIDSYNWYLHSFLPRITIPGRHISPERLPLGGMTEEHVSLARQVFDSLLQKDSPVRPNTDTYTIMFKIYVNAGDLDTASSLEKHWRRNLGVHLSEDVYVCLMQVCKDLPFSSNYPFMLILFHQACIARKEFRRADKIYEFYQSTLGQAPTIAMINQRLELCARTEQAEKALEIFDELDVSPTRETYTQLIYALGSRDDYYIDAFRLFQQMLDAGHTPMRHTFHALLHAAGKHGDVPRAQMLWNDMTLSSDDAFKPVPKTAFLFMRVVYRLCKLRQGNDLALSLPGATPVDRTVADGGWVFSEVPLVGTPLLDYMDGFWREFVCARGWHRDPSHGKQLCDAFLSLYAPYGNLAAGRALDVWGTLYDGKHVQPDGRSFTALLKGVAKNPGVMREHGDRLWSEFEAWDARMESGIIPSQGGQARQLVLQDIENQRRLNDRDRDSVAKILCLFVRGWAKYPLSSLVPTRC